MRKMLCIVKFEIMRLVSDWRKTLSMIFVPAIVMLLTFYLFPAVVNYLNTGSLGRTKVMVVNAPNEFTSYLERYKFNTVYKFIEVDSEDYDSKKEILDGVDKGNIIMIFKDEYEARVKDYYQDLEEFYSIYTVEGTSINILDDDSIEAPTSSAKIDVIFKNDFTYSARATQLEDYMLKDFIDSYPDAVGANTSDIPDSHTSINSFNPIGKVIENRAYANERAARIIPQLIILILYYCIYSLSFDIFAGDRDRGFLRRLIMCPVSSKAIIGGKIITSALFSLFSSVVIFFIMIFASWLNISNDALSLLPFGVLILPKQFIKILLVCFSSSLMMITLTAWMIFDLTKPEETTVNLQFPLAIILVDMFIFMFRSIETMWFEYLLPIHNAITSIQSIILNTDNTLTIATTVIANLLFTALILHIIFKKEAYI